MRVSVRHTLRARSTLPQPAVNLQSVLREGRLVTREADEQRVRHSRAVTAGK